MKKYIILSLTIMLLVVGGCKKKNDTVSPGSIYGTITDKSTGESVPNAGVELMPKGLKTVTGYDGTFQFTQIDPGDYNLFITKTGYQDLKSNTITVKAGKTAKGDVQIEKMPTSIQIIDNGGQEISSIDFGEEEGVVSKTFNIHNRGTESFSFSIIKSVDWIESITPATGTVPVNQNAPVILKIDRTKMVNGLNTTSIIVSSETVGGIEIAVKATKKKALSILDNSGTEITELDFGSDANTTQKMFKIRNNGTQSLSYSISKTANWITSVNPTSGALNSGATSSISIMINRDLLSDGENSSVLSINITNGGSEELVVKATKGSPYTGTCTVIFELFDTFGDGWNGAKLGVSDGTSTHQLTISSGGNIANYSFDFSVGTSISVTFSGGAHDNECSYRIYYPGGDVIFEKAAGSITSGLQCTFTVDCNNPGGGGGGGSNGTWLYYGDYNNHVNCWGLTNGGSDEWAVMFPTSTLSQYNGTSITKVDVYLGATGSYTLKIYKGGTYQPSALLKSQTFSVSSEGWNTINISPLALQTNNSLWVSISCSYNAGVYPKGACAGVNNRNARWVNPNGNGWHDVYDDNNATDICWEIQAYVTNDVKGEDGTEIQLPQTLINIENSSSIEMQRNPNEVKKYK